MQMTSILFLLSVMALVILSLPVCVEAETRTISWSGYTWWVKSSQEPVGPGPNWFSDSPRNVWVDRQGRLHLRITYQNGRWHCAEVVCTRSLGYGTYRFYVVSPVANMDPHVVLGLFTWSDDPAYANREIDIEFATWGEGASSLNAQYVVQPATSGRLHRFQMDRRISSSVHEFTWLADSVSFLSVRGSKPSPSTPSDVIQQWKFAGEDIPQRGDENPRINLWLVQGKPPQNGKEAEVVISRFEFIPAP